jgi:hypothetical protein
LELFENADTAKIGGRRKATVVALDLAAEQEVCAIGTK